MLIIGAIFLFSRKRHPEVRFLKPLIFNISTKYNLSAFFNILGK